MTLRGSGRDNTSILASVGKKKHISGMRAQAVAINKVDVGVSDGADVRRRKFVRSNSLGSGRVVKKAVCPTRVDAYKATINDDVLNCPKKQLTNDAAQPLQSRKHFDNSNRTNLANLTDYGHDKENMSRSKQRNTFHDRLLATGFPEKRQRQFSKKGLESRCVNAPTREYDVPRRSSSACATFRNPITSTKTVLI
eukprot:TRINITY_DN5966_c0_g1_i1.p1 TRINITY_DN5966_c0_g1~~TRINITY_DN5966_c0_g1_i1.p1  ORF type:complete len:195 (+),score=23.01 TRINITY_DN5966_c0_g1_i1:137-721(+)